VKYLSEMWHFFKSSRTDYMKEPITFGLTEQDSHQLGLERHEGFYKMKMGSIGSESTTSTSTYVFFLKGARTNCKCRPRTFLPSVSFTLSHLWLRWNNQKGHAGSDSWRSLHHTASVLDLLLDDTLALHKSERKVDFYSIWIICGEEHCVTKTDLNQEFLSHDNRC